MSSDRASVVAATIRSDRRGCGILVGASSSRVCVGGCSAYRISSNTHNESRQSEKQDVLVMFGRLCFWASLSSVGCSGSFGLGSPEEG